MIKDKGWRHDKRFAEAVLMQSKSDSLNINQPLGHKSA